MRYRPIFERAYVLTFRHPIWWLFGLFLASGFNLNVLYAMVSQRSGIAWQALRQAIEGKPLLVVFGGSVGAVLVFILLNYVKAWFISEAHEQLHAGQEIRCPLCSGREQRRTWQQRMPSLKLLIHVLLPSALTVAATVVTLMPLNYLLSQGITESSGGVISLTFIASLLIVCALATWNFFTVTYIIFHKQRFGNAAKLALDLLSMRTKHVFEFIMLLIAAYALFVLIGSIFIVLSQLDSTPNWAGTLPLFVSGKAAAGLAFIVWFAITNVFFNLSLLVFFDQLVRPIPKAEPAPIGIGQPV